jgi:hypothetical protein
MAEKIIRHRPRVRKIRAGIPEIHHVSIYPGRRERQWPAYNGHPVMLRLPPALYDRLEAWRLKYVPDASRPATIRFILEVSLEIVRRAEKRR